MCVCCGGWGVGVGGQLKKQQPDPRGLPVALLEEANREFSTKTEKTTTVFLLLKKKKKIKVILPRVKKARQTLFKTIAIGES